VLTTDVEGRLAALNSSTRINGFQFSVFDLPFSEANASGMVSRKNQGFQVSESRQNRVRLNVSNWMMMGALNGRSETGSETEQVGSGMNGRRRSARAVLERPMSA
jgi:hypothetical protein